jgi:tripartite-type tricarboxylate transporter receptor subunit TctC
MSSNLSKLVVSIALIGSVTSVTAQEVNFPVPFAPGGYFSTLVPLTASDLDKQGWKINVNFAGKCGVALEQFRDSKKPALTVWSSSWLKKDNTCYIDVDENNLVDIYMQIPDYFCGPKNTPNWTPVKGETYTVGVTRSFSEQQTNALNAYGKKLGVTFKQINYTNTGNVKTAYHTNEVDMVFSSIGLEQQKTNGSRCLVTSATEPVENINTIWAETGLDPDSVRVSFLVLNPVGLTADQAERLKQDVRTILATNQDIKAYMQNKYLLGVPGTIQKQLTLIKQ